MRTRTSANITMLVLGFIFLTITLISQDADPNEIIDNLKVQLEKVNDYSADIEIEVDVSFINMPVKHATIFYKSPDKLKFKSDEFFMLPKRGINNRFNKILEEEYTAIYAGSEILNNEEHHIVKIIPLGKKPEIIMATWWVNAEKNLISKSESNTRNEGTYVVEFIYNDPGITLPTVMIFSFEIENLNLPLKFIGKTAGMEFDKTKAEGRQTGKVFIRFSNYVINSNLGDELFTKEESEK